MRNSVILLVVGVGVGLAVWWFWGLNTAKAPSEIDQTACTLEAKLCPDGSSVGRVGPDCAFTACPRKPVDPVVTESVTAVEDQIVISIPEPGAYVASPLQINGSARGTWFFEGSFSVVLTDWDGRIIAEAVVTSREDWMTEDMIPFQAELTFASPYTAADPEFMKRGTLILQKANPSGLPENDTALEFPVWFVPDSSN